MTWAAVRWGLGITLLLAGLGSSGHAGYLALKAKLAQYLLERSWAAAEAQSGVRTPARPWPWADMAPLARMRFVRQRAQVMVLDNAHPRTLAFGPGHVTRTPWVESRAGRRGKSSGQTLIAGHRDTHFAVLEDLAVGDRIELEDGAGRSTWRVLETAVIHQDAGEVIESRTGTGLWLVTCYPFDALAPGTVWRYVVHAVPQRRSAGFREESGPEPPTHALDRGSI